MPNGTPTTNSACAWTEDGATYGKVALRERRVKMKTRTFAVSLFALASVFATVPGCRRESTRVDDAKQEIDPQIEDLEDTFKQIETWQNYREVCRKTRFFGGILEQKINAVKDPATRMKYFNRLYDLAFSVPFDATDPATRSYQLTSFFVMTDDAQGCAQEYEDVDTEWSICLRRLKILKAELQKVEAFFEGRQHGDTFKGSRDDWKDYREEVNGVYGRYDIQVSKYFRDSRTGDGLTYERWHYFHSQFEELLGHKVEVWPCVLEKWEKERQKRAAADKTKDIK